MSSAKPKTLGNQRQTRLSENNLTKHQCSTSSGVSSECEAGTHLCLFEVEPHRFLRKGSPSCRVPSLKIWEIWGTNVKLDCQRAIQQDIGVDIVQIAKA